MTTRLPAPQMRPPQPIVLESAHVRLEPLLAAHAPELYAIGQDPLIWTHHLRGPFESLEDTRGYMATALQAQAAGSELPFVIRQPDGTLVGMSRYLDILTAHAGLEIGHTWLVPAVWRTVVNTAAKRLLIGHAFDDLGASRVSLKTDNLNERSQRAIERLGAVREGVLRAHRRRQDGSLRDTVYYSIVASEWPLVKATLDRALAQKS